VRDAEAYYRAMFRGGAASWNLRDRHMMSTLETLREQSRRTGRADRAVVWAHNSHLGDARATAMAAGGELNLGQLARERYGTACTLIGMTTHTGTVTAAPAWDGPAELKDVRASLPDSYERLFHEAGVPSFMLRLSEQPLAHDLSVPPRLERAIGVIYRPDSERRSHYFAATLPAQFDTVVHIDETRALEPLERWSRHDADLPETYPTGV
jgi:erythromycin esterase-like protein